MKDLDKFKDSLLTYLQAKNIDVSRNPIFCFNPGHSNNKTPAMVIYKDHYSCKGSCGIHGDIYDACKIITGITDFNEKFEEVERTLTGFNESGMKPIKRQETVIDPEAVDKIQHFILNHKGREKGVMAFLKERGYSHELANKINVNYGYWPGLEQAKKKFDDLTLRLAGIPEYAWYHSGVVCKLASGYKLMWYGTYKKEGYGCHKFNSLSAKTFPAPFTKLELQGTVIITEAETSAISMRGSGFKNVYSCGSVQGITKYNSELLEKCEKIILFFDGDTKGNAGQYYSGLAPFLIDKNTGKETTPKTTAEKIYENSYKGKIYGVKTPLGEDPDDMIRAGKIDEIKKLISEAKLIEYTEKEVKKVSKPENKKPKTKKENKETSNVPFKFLGFDKRYYYIYPNIQKMVLDVPRGDSSIKNMLFELAEKKFWWDNFLGQTTVKGITNSFLKKDMAMEWLRNESFKKGMFDPNKIKGVGAHFENGKVIINTGSNIKTSVSKSVEYDCFEGENIYVQSIRKFKLSGKAWDHKEGKNLWKQINTFSFEKNMDSIAVMGFMTLSPFSGVLFRRPGLWVTAGSGIGKSTLFKQLLQPATGGEKGSLIIEGITSEAYIRQTLEKDCITVYVDEFEAHNIKDKVVIDSILKLNRSSYGGGKSGKGSTGHKPIEFLLKSMFCFGSVGVNLDVQADDSRIHICRLKEREGQDECKAPKSFDGLRMRTFSNLKKILEDIDICKKMIIGQGFSDRIGDTYSPFLAGSWNTLSDHPFLEGPEKNLISYFDNALCELAEKQTVYDEDKIINRVLEQRIRIDSQEELTIAEMLTFTRKDLADKNDENWLEVKNIKSNEILHDARIQRHGLRRFKINGNTEVLAFSLKSSEIKSYLKETPFANYQEELQRSKLVIDKDRNVRMSGKGTRSVIFDWIKFKEKYLDVN